MSYAQLGEYCIDGTHLDPGSAAAVSQLRGVDVVLSVRRKHRQRAESIDDLIAVPGAREALQQLLEHQSRRDYGLPSFEGRLQGVDFA